MMLPPLRFPQRFLHQRLWLRFPPLRFPPLRFPLRFLHQRLWLRAPFLLSLASLMVWNECQIERLNECLNE
jgi:hypothetical protein